MNQPRRRWVGRRLFAIVRPVAGIGYDCRRRSSAGAAMHPDTPGRSGVLSGIGRRRAMFRRATCIGRCTTGSTDQRRTHSQRQGTEPQQDMRFDTTPGGAPSRIPVTGSAGLIMLHCGRLNTMTRTVVNSRKMSIGVCLQRFWHHRHFTLRRGHLQTVLNVCFRHCNPHHLWRSRTTPSHHRAFNSASGRMLAIYAIFCIYSPVWEPDTTTATVETPG